LAARGEALGGAVSASAEGADALLSNPAGLASLGPASPSDLTLSYDNLLETSYLGYMAYGRSVGQSSALGADAIYFSQQPMTAYDQYGNAGGTFQPNDLAVTLAYATRFESVSIGAGIKMIRSSVDDANGVSAALDFGVQAKSLCLLGGRPVDAGAHFSNLGPAIKLGGVSAPLPFSMTGGVVWHAISMLDGLLDLHMPVDQPAYASVGVEGVMRFDHERRKAVLRVGYNQSHDRDVTGFTGFTVGAGLDLDIFRLDYAWVAFGALGMMNRVTVGFRF
jgi:hypothetical protein